MALGDAPCVTLENDLNTRAEDAAAASYRPDAIAAFFKEAPPEAERIVEHYLSDDWVR